jgi:hypothetical protein
MMCFLTVTGEVRIFLFAAVALYGGITGPPALCGTPSPVDLYVSPNGLDSNSGAPESPLRTIQAASQLAKQGTTVHVAPGNYEGGFVTSASGTNSAHVAYISDVQWSAKIVGGHLSNANDAAWWNRGDYVDIKGFEIDGRSALAATWRIGLYGTGSHTMFLGDKVHDILTDPEAYAAAAASRNGGAGVDMDRYYGGNDGDVIGNLVFNIGPSHATGNLVHGIYQTQSGRVADNVIYNVIGMGIHLWHGAQDIVIANNTVDGARSVGIVVGSGDSGSSATSGDHISVANNIITNSKGGIRELGITGPHNKYVNNLVYHTGWIVRLRRSVAVGTIIGDPKFVNPEAHDYHLQAGSPAIGAATMDYAPATDFDGHPQALGTSGALGAYNAARP